MVLGHQGEFVQLFIGKTDCVKGLPSEQDKRLTQPIKQAGTILDIPVLDHVIMTVDGYYSFADEGELWSSLYLMISSDILDVLVLRKKMQ